MELPPHIRDSLRDLGFTDYETSIYVTLTTKGALNAKDLSKHSGVPYSRIYQILQTLSDKNFIIRDEEEKPTTYTAVPPGDALRIARDRYVNDVNSKTQTLFDALNPIYLMKSIPQRLEVFHIEGSENCIAQIRTMISRTQDFLIISTASKEVLEQIHTDIEKLRSRGVSNIKILVQQGIFGSDHRTSDLFKEYAKIAELRVAPTIFGTMVIADESGHTFLMFQKLFLGTGGFSGIFSENPLIGPLSKEWFNYLYTEGKKLN